MNAVLTVLQLVLFFAVTAIPPPHLANGRNHNRNTLVLLHVLFRHGNRTPDKQSLFPNDIYQNETYEPFGYSQLTPKGKRTEYEIGRYIRSTYGDLIPKQYTPDVAYAITTNFKRTKMSLELVLSGLFPPLPNDIFEPNLEWQPVPFNIETDENVISVAPYYCANYINQYYQYLMSKEARDICAGYAELYQKMSVLGGYEIRNPRDLSNMYFSFKSEEDYGLPLPIWIVPYYPNILEEAVSVDYEFSTATPTLKKLSAGFLLKKILADSMDKRDGNLSEERKIFLYSAHEYNIATMLRALNVFYRHVPPFGAAIFFELHNIKGQYGLKLFYQNYKKNKPVPLTIPGCSHFCPLDDVYRLLQDSLPADDDVCVYKGELM